MTARFRRPEDAIRATVDNGQRHPDAVVLVEHTAHLVLPYAVQVVEP